MLPFACLDFCSLPFASLGTFTFQDSHPLPCPGCLWLSSPGSCCFHLSSLPLARVPFHRPRLPTAPAREFPPVNKQGFPPLPWEASTPARIAKGQGAAPNLWCPGAPDHSQGRAGSLSYGPGLTLPVTAKSPWILDPAGRSRCSQGSPFPAHREISSTSAWEGWHTNPCSGAQQ